MQKYKAILIDVDGTLVVNKKDGVPTNKVSKALERANEKIHVGIATSRCFSAVEYLLPYINLSGPSILNGGGQIIDMQTKKAYYECPILYDDVISITDELKKRNISICVCIGENACTIPTKEIEKKPFMIFSQGLDDALANELIEIFSNNPRLSTHKTKSWTEGKSDILITHVKATKQHGVIEIAKALDITPQEIIGVGDGYNDFPLLMTCGLKVAMGNAIVDLKEIADYVAPSVEDDGVADVIEKFILNPVNTH